MFSASDFDDLGGDVQVGRVLRQFVRQGKPLRIGSGFYATGLHNAMYAIHILALAAALVLFMASRTMEKDVRKQETAT
ncbi:MAG: hypothetical protein QOF42_1711 [Gammaproteobacteria bacterium]|jgi:hypothetical protein|nr:hypothetical protein [Gammaproteobacteria bacterium]